MNTAPTIKFTDGELKVGVATARLLLQHALDTEDQELPGEHPDLRRKRAVNDLTGSSIHVPPKVPTEEKSGVTTKPLEPDAVIRTNSAYD